METSGVTSLGRHWRALLYVINICRFSLVILVAETVLLTVGQGQDLLLSIADKGIGAYLTLLGSCWIWAFSIWLWTRTLLEINFPDISRDNDLLISYRRWLPRMLGLLAFVSVTFALWNAGKPASQYMLPTIITGVIFTLLVSKRRPLGRWAANKLSAQPEQHWLYVPDMKSNAPQYDNWRDAYATNLGKVAAALLGLWLVLFLWGIISPESMGWWMNAQMLLMLWGATFLTVGSIVTYWGNKTGIPVMTGLFAMVMVFSLWNDNHAIRPMPGDSKPSDRVSIKQALAAWREVNCPNGECKPFVLVATAGGGIRAAYWTGTVLGHIHGKEPKGIFKDRLFAISAVSGGAVGSTVFRSMLEAKERGACKEEIIKCTLSVLSVDFLSPLSASLLYPDITQWFLPLSLFDDRGVTLEKAFADSFEATTGLDLLSQSFSQLSRSERPWPALFLNATWTNNGRRIVASSLDISQESEFFLTNDQLNIIGYDVRVITAAHNSARAPYVSPAGSWHAGKGDNKTAGPIKGRLQDGGLFDTFGAKTASEIFAYAKAELKDQFKPLVIQISSTPSMPKDLAKSPAGQVSNIAHQFIAMFRTVFATTDGHAAELASRLKQRTEAETKGTYAYFRMCKPDDEANPPFGWALSEQAQLTIQSYLLDKDVFHGTSLKTTSCTDENQQAAKRVLAVLNNH